MANSGNVKFIDNSEAAKGGLFEQQKQALRAVAKMLKKRVKDAAPKTTTGSKHDGALKKNIGTWVRTNRKTGDTVLYIGTYNRKTADKKGLYHAFYANWLELGCSRPDLKPRPFLKNTCFGSIADIRAEEAKYLPNIKPMMNPTDDDEEVAEDV